MVEYKLATEGQKELATLAADIMRNMLTKERIDELEHADNGLGQYPMDVHKALAEAGFSGMNVPEEYGGLGFDTITMAVIIEEMSKVDTGFAFSFYNAGSMFPLIEQSQMSREEKQKIADGLGSGEMIGTFALTESSAGSDAGAMRTSAVFDEKANEWVINGSKIFISNATIADSFFVAAWTDKTKRASEGVTFFVVERGVKIGKKEAKLGIKLSETAEIILDDVRVPADHLPRLPDVLVWVLPHFPDYRKQHSPQKFWRMSHARPLLKSNFTFQGFAAHFFSFVNPFYIFFDFIFS